MGDVEMECVNIHAEKRFRDVPLTGGVNISEEWCYDSTLRSVDGDMTLADRTWGVQPFVPGKRYHVVITPAEEG